MGDRRASAGRPARDTASVAPIVVTGAAGQLGVDLASALSMLGRVVALGRGALDVTDAGRVREVVRTLRPRVVVNAAAYTAVDAAERERDAAWRVNAEAPGVLAAETARVGAVLVHYSTDHVFDGTKAGAYAETDAPAPVNVYGETKLAGERAVCAAGGMHLIFRTSWVYAPRGRNFVRTMLRLAHEQEELRVVSDQVGAPTASAELARATRDILARVGATDPRDHPTSWWGTYHLAAAGATSRYDLAREVLALDPRRPAQRCRRVVPIATREHDAPARRPLNSRLDTTRVRETFGIVMPHWREPLAEIVRALSAEEAA